MDFQLVPNFSICSQSHGNHHSAAGGGGGDDDGGEDDSDDFLFRQTTFAILV